MPLALGQSPAFVGRCIESELSPPSEAAMSLSKVGVRRCYEPQRLLGRGAFGTVILARLDDVDESSGGSSSSSLRVVKQVELHGADDKQRTEALQETEVLRCLCHPNIIGYYEAFLEGATLCIAMEYADGGDLAAAIARRRDAGQRYQERDALAVMSQLVLAVQYMHERLILHRDMKSQNVFLTSSGVVKLGDFGIAKVLRASLQRCETRVGTPYYLPPEIIENKPYDYKADVWGAGVVFYEVLALEVPFSANNIAALAVRICATEPRPVPAMYGAETRALLGRMLAKNPEDRPSIGDIAALPHICRAVLALQPHSVGAAPVANTPPAAVAPTETPSPFVFPIAESSDTGVWKADGGPRVGLGGCQSAPVDLAEAEFLLDPSPVKRLMSSLSFNPSPVEKPGSAFLQSCSFDLAEFEMLLHTSAFSGSPEVAERRTTTIRQPARNVVESSMTCFSMLRNLENEFGFANIDSFYRTTT